MTVVTVPFQIDVKITDPVYGCPRDLARHHTCAATVVLGAPVLKLELFGPRNSTMMEQVGISGRKPGVL